MKLADLRREEQIREPSHFGVSLRTEPDLIQWRKAGIIEVIERGVRDMIDIVQTASKVDHGIVFEHLTSLHKFLLDPLNPDCGSILSTSKQTQHLAEIIAYILLSTVTRLSTELKIKSIRYTKMNDVAKDMCICLSTALPNDLHVLDETLSALFHSQNKLSIENKHYIKSNAFISHFENELAHSVNEYVTTYCHNSYAEMGNKSHYDLSRFF